MSTDISYYGSAARASNNSSNTNANNTTEAHKIFVGGLSWQTSEESLRYHFEQYGPVVSVEVMRDRVTGDPRGFAFVVFQDPETVDLVMNEDRHEVNHRNVDVKRAQARGVAPPSIHKSANAAADASAATGAAAAPRAGADKGGMTPEQLQNKVFIGGLPQQVDRDELRRIFEQFGAVADAIVMMDQVQQRSRGFGFVTFEDGTNGAQHAVAAQPVNVHGRMVEVKLATPKGDQERRFPPAAGPKNVGLRAGMGSSTGEYAGLAAAFGRSGWKAGYGSFAFSSGGWRVNDWEDFAKPPERSGFSFDMLKEPTTRGSEPPPKRSRRE